MLAVGICACRTGVNYRDPAGPRYSEALPAGATAAVVPCTMRVVSFNVERALRVDTAIGVMRSHAALRQADVILLQEMDDAGARRVAKAFGMGYVYYPATLSLKTHRDFGNAVLSRWPIVDDRKILLPHVGRVGRLQRIATAATIDVGGTPVRVYSVHLGTMLETAPSAMRAQLQTVLTDARRHPRVVLGGDLNSHGVAREAIREGFAWPTQDGPRTAPFGRWDHILLKGLASPEADAAGTVLEVGGASDHRPVWAVALVSTPADR